MVVKITAILKKKLEAHKIDSELFIDSFKEWKSGDEYGSYAFGKDSAYIAPSVNGEPYVLRHVHLVPIQDENQLSVWNKNWRLKRRKTSNRALVYVKGNKDKFLLITILDEPRAHEVVLMKTQDDKELMHRFAVVAEEFLADGSIII
jgi:mRNA interferase YafO